MCYIMVLVVLLRGPSAVGKTTIARKILFSLKSDYQINCAFISEDNFRKKMQFKYKSTDKIVHLNSVKLIHPTIKQLLNLDKYDLIIIEGLFRYKEMINAYIRFCFKENYKFIIFQLNAPRKVRQKRDKISKSRDHVVGIKSETTILNGEEFPHKSSILLDTTQTVNKSTQKILSYIVHTINSNRF